MSDIIRDEGVRESVPQNTPAGARESVPQNTPEGTPGSGPERIHESGPNEKKRKLYILLCVIPALIILALTVVLLVRGAAGSGSTARTASPGAPGDTAITVKQKERKSLLENKQTVEVETVQDGLREMGFLITEEYYFTEMLTNRKVQSLGVLELGFTEESYTVSYEGYITAGIDFNGINVAADDSAKTVTVTLPPAVMKDTVIDPDSIRVYNEKHSIFNDFTEKERGDAMTKFKADVQAKAREKGIVEKAARNAELVIRNFVLGFLPPDYTVDIIPQEPVDASQQGSTGAQHGISAPQQGITAPQEGFVPARKGGSGQ